MLLIVKTRWIERAGDYNDSQDGGGFEQIEPLGKIRQWRCLGCDKIVTLEDR